MSLWSQLVLVNVDEFAPCQRMAESVSTRNFYRDKGMHYMASQATTGNTDEDLFHDAHLQLQEQMRNPIAFHAEMMGDIIYL